MLNNSYSKSINQTYFLLFIWTANISNDMPITPLHNTHQLFVSMVLLHKKCIIKCKCTVYATNIKITTFIDTCNICYQMLMICVTSLLCNTQIRVNINISFHTAYTIGDLQSFRNVLRWYVSLISHISYKMLNIFNSTYLIVLFTSSIWSAPFIHSNVFWRMVILTFSLHDQVLSVVFSSSSISGGRFRCMVPFGAPWRPTWSQRISWPLDCKLYCPVIF